MASLSNYWLSQRKKDKAERVLVANREKKENYSRKCVENDLYHKNLALKVSKYNTLSEISSGEKFSTNVESRIRENMQALAKEQLVSRRQKLSRLLASENQLYMRELEEMESGQREKDPWNIAHLKQEIEKLQKERLQNEQLMQKRYMHHLYRSSVLMNQADDEAQNAASELWHQRKEESEKLSVERQLMEQGKVDSLKRARSEVEAKVDLLLEKQLKEKENCSSLVDSRKSELSNVEAELRSLEHSKSLLDSILMTLLDMKEQRGSLSKRLEESFSKIQGIRQPKEKIRKMSIEVQQSLDYDYKLLTKINLLSERNSGSSELSFVDFNIAAVIGDDILRSKLAEKKNELDVQLFYEEEANDILTKNLAHWRIDSESRDRRIDNLFANLMDEVNAKLRNLADVENGFLTLKHDKLQQVEEAVSRASEVDRQLEEEIQCHLNDINKLSKELASSTQGSQLSRT